MFKRKQREYSPIWEGSLPKEFPKETIEIFPTKYRKHSSLWNGLYPGSTYNANTNNTKKSGLFRRNACTLWDKYLPPLLILVAIGFVAYYFQLIILAILFGVFIVGTLASGFGR